MGEGAEGEGREDGGEGKGRVGRGKEEQRRRGGGKNERRTCTLSENVRPTLTNAAGWVGNLRIRVT